jgi:hypothetical protein
VRIHPVVDAHTPENVETNGVKGVITTSEGGLAVVASITGTTEVTGEVVVTKGPTTGTKTGTGTAAGKETNEMVVIVTKTATGMTETEETEGASAKRTRTPWTKIAPRGKGTRRTSTSQRQALQASTTTMCL